MLKFINEKLGVNKFEAILVAIILMGLTLLFKEQINMVLKDLLFGDMDNLINQFLN